MADGQQDRWRGGADQQSVQRLRTMIADMMVELQRADGKATALRGAAGGLLAACVGVLSEMDAAPQGLVVALLWASIVLTAATGTALWALRPVLPRPSSPGKLLGGQRGTDVLPLIASLAAMSDDDRLHGEEERLAVMAVLARRKFRMVRIAVDLLATALTVAGIALLVAYVPG
ncbi:Pycsar system effector family protein [Streptomyces sp. MJP52]|uniref:Pycsar system effector family protein n=1 Tax=Streptomyces sp. MJP52 TaxID=2940555 RepID=UPI002476AB9C|nr:Pycsar system effector family protein [Streptomyces sp. MJP52]MDH6223044.1 hypothetical protein [Streptomyces sp. MJP52]MDH6228932.1 hypothetical protein [Streptomyces sp. MJP52]